MYLDVGREVDPVDVGGFEVWDLYDFTWAFCYTPDRKNTIHGITGRATGGILTPRLDLLPYLQLDQLGRPQKKSIEYSHALGMSSRSAGIDGMDSEDELMLFYLKSPTSCFL